MEIENNNEKEFKKLRFIIVLLSVLVVLVFVGGIFLGGNINSGKTFDKQETKNTEKEEKKDDFVFENGETITKEEAEIFLKDLIPTYIVPDLIVETGTDDVEVYLQIMRHVFLKNTFDKTGETYIVKEEIIKDLAYKYYMRDSFKYYDENQVKYDATNKTYNFEMNLVLFSPVPTFKKASTIKEFAFKNGYADLVINSKVVFENSNIENGKREYDYHVLLVKEKGKMRILKVSKTLVNS